MPTLLRIVNPLVFNSDTGVPEVLAGTDLLELNSQAIFQNPVGFNGANPMGAVTITGDFGTSLDLLIDGLAAMGLLNDQRPNNWLSPSLAQLLAVGPYEPGRLIIGGVGGWQQLDMPAYAAGEIQVPVANSGVEEFNPYTGLGVRQLSYSSILSLGPNPPLVNPLPAALWYSTDQQCLLIWNGSSWEPAIGPTLGSLSNLTGSGAVVLDGGIAKAVLSNTPGYSLVSTAAEPAWVEWIHTALTPAWNNGQSATDPLPAGGGRPAGVTSAIWCNPAGGNSSAMGFWDEASHRWLTVPVANTVINGLGQLAEQVLAGDLFTVGQQGQVVRLPIGAVGQSLSATATGVGWRARFSSGAVAPSDPIPGDIWERPDGVFVIWSDSGWQPITDQGRVGGTNSSGAAVTIGKPMVSEGNGWVLADGRTAAAAPMLLGLALASSGPGQPVLVATGGVVSGAAADWNAVVDPADHLPAGSGLKAGASYYLSGNLVGMLSQTPGPGKVLVGSALDSTHLLLQIGQYGASDMGRIYRQATVPAGAVVDELWFDEGVGQLMSAVNNGGVLAWQPVAPPLSVSPLPVDELAFIDAEVIDYLPDPTTAGLRLVHANGEPEDILLKGTGGMVITMSDDRTFSIDGTNAGIGRKLTKVDGGVFTLN